MRKVQFTIPRLFEFLLICSILSCNAVIAQDGKALFISKCQVCHGISKDLTGPALKGFELKHKWSDRNELLKWIQDPAGYMVNDKYTQDLKEKYGSVMLGYPDMTLEEVGAITDYINKKAKEEEEKTKSPKVQSDSSYLNSFLLGAFAITLAIILLILMSVNRGLKRMVDEKEGETIFAPIPFFRNKTFIVLMVIILSILSGYFITKGAIELGRTQNYTPKQPIFFSHKVHTGLNQINCLYCHGGAWNSKQASIPSVNVCMNCHKAIHTYEKGPDLFNIEGKRIDGTKEIEKLFDYANFDPNNPNVWDPDTANPIRWISVHNLPEHVYFNHAQHVKVGNQQCQTCHGEITNMDEVKQFSDLSMSWCINCHRTTGIDFNYDSTGNAYYSTYLQFHEAIKSGNMDSICLLYTSDAADE